MQKNKIWQTSASCTVNIPCIPYWCRWMCVYVWRLPKTILVNALLHVTHLNKYGYAHETNTIVFTTGSQVWIELLISNLPLSLEDRLKITVQGWSSEYFFICLSLYTVKMPQRQWHHACIGNVLTISTNLPSSLPLNQMSQNLNLRHHYIWIDWLSRSLPSRKAR